MKTWNSMTFSSSKTSRIPPPPPLLVPSKQSRSFTILRRPPPPHASSSSSPQPESLSNVMQNIMSALAAMQQPQTATDVHGADLWVSNVSFHPPGSPDPLLQHVSLHLPPNSLGLIFGRSGAGKSTLLQLIAGLLEPTVGAISMEGPLLEAAATGLTPQQRMARAGLVFQFPERHFVGATLAEELTAGWPGGDTAEGMMTRQLLSVRASKVLAAVELDSIPITTRLSALSDGYKRRVALAVQLVRRPELLVLDEPLAGLDWRTRGEIVRLLAALKAECTVLVVSHDLKELAPLADRSWRMRGGGVLVREDLSVS